VELKRHFLVHAAEDILMHYWMLWKTVFLEPRFVYKCTHTNFGETFCIYPFKTMRELFCQTTWNLKSLLMQAQEIITERKDRKSYYNRSMNKNVTGDRCATQTMLKSKRHCKLFIYVHNGHWSYSHCISLSCPLCH
jgi:hypothetical protein